MAGNGRMAGSTSSVTVVTRVQEHDAYNNHGAVQARRRVARRRAMRRCARARVAACGQAKVGRGSNAAYARIREPTQNNENP